jgi:predicted nucleic acid-binding protein
MHKLFIDSDIVLDVFAKREPFYYHSAKLLTLIEKKKVAGYTSPLVFGNIYYILRKLKPKDHALQSLRKFRIIVGVFSVDEKHIDLALCNSTLLSKKQPD